MQQHMVQIQQRVFLITHGQILLGLVECHVLVYVHAVAVTHDTLAVLPPANFRQGLDETRVIGAQQLCRIDQEVVFPILVRILICPALAALNPTGLPVIQP